MRRVLASGTFFATPQKGLVASLCVSSAHRYTSSGNGDRGDAGAGPSPPQDGVNSTAETTEAPSGAGMAFAAPKVPVVQSTTLKGRSAPTLTRVSLRKPSQSTTNTSSADPTAPRMSFSVSSDSVRTSGVARAGDGALDIRDLTATGVPESATGVARALAASGSQAEELRKEASSGDRPADDSQDSIMSQKDKGHGSGENEVVEALGSKLYGTLQGGTKVDHGPLRPTGMWEVKEVIDEKEKTVDFRRIDDVESEIMETLEERDHALILVEDEDKWKHKLMFRHKFKKTPKHLTWKEMGQEIECLDCIIDLDPHRPEERFTIKFQFVDKRKGTRDIVWEAHNDVSYSEGFTDMMAAIGSCLGRADVFRTVRFDDGKGTTRELTIRKKSRFTSDIQISFRPAQTYNVYERKESQDNHDKEVAAEGLSSWGFHPQLMDPEYRDAEDPEGTYTLSFSAHAFSFIMLRCIDRLITKPLKEFYRPSQIAKRAKVQSSEEIGLSHAMKGWLGVDEQIFPHYTPIEALQEHWLGPDAPFTFVAIVNKLREMTYLKKQNPEFVSWLAVRKHDTSLAIRNVSMKMLGAGASTLFVPRTHNTTANFLLPKNERRRLESNFSLNAALGMPDETKNIAEFKKLTGNHKIGDGTTKDAKDQTQPPSTK